MVTSRAGPSGRSCHRARGIAAGLALQVGEDAIAAFRLQIAQPVAKELLEIHRP